MRKLLLFSLILAATISIGSAGAQAGTNWKCGPGPSIEAHGVANGIEITYLPPLTYSIKIRAAKDLAGHGMRFFKITDEELASVTVPFIWHPPTGLKVVQLLAKKAGEKGNPYPPAGCPTGKIIAGEEPVEEPVEEPEEKHEETGTKDCFAHPEVCGFGGLSTSGASNECSAPTSGTIFSHVDGEVIANKHIVGNIVVQNKNVKVENVCLEHNGEGNDSNSALLVKEGSSGTVILKSTIRGINSTNESDAHAIFAGWGGSSIIIEDSSLYNCGECVLIGNGTSLLVTAKSYIDANAAETGGHYEGIYTSDSSVVVEGGSTVLNPHAQTAAIFGDTHEHGGGVCDNSIIVKASLLAGGGASIYPCGNATELGGGLLSVVGVRFAKCLGAPHEEPIGAGGEVCAGQIFNSMTAMAMPSSDGFGFWPRYGYFGILSDGGKEHPSSRTWLNNVDDHTNELIVDPG